MYSLHVYAVAPWISNPDIPHPRQPDANTTHPCRCVSCSRWEFYLGVHIVGGQWLLGPEDSGR